MYGVWKLGRLLTTTSLPVYILYYVYITLPCT